VTPKSLVIRPNLHRLGILNDTSGLQHNRYAPPTLITSNLALPARHSSILNPLLRGKTVNMSAFMLVALTASETVDASDGEEAPP
jgi:hypothetical protein